MSLRWTCTQQNAALVEEFVSPPPAVEEQVSRLTEAGSVPDSATAAKKQRNIGCGKNRGRQLRRVNEAVADSGGELGNVLPLIGKMPDKQKCYR